jgi:polyisoprenyl-phosphate glycosyltransferase
MNRMTGHRVVVVAPVYDDAEAARRLLEELGKAFAGTDADLNVLLVDDGSPVPVRRRLRLPSGPDVPRVSVLRLRRNLGHQRAIAVGIAHVFEQANSDTVVVMDADGEDRPEDAVRLVAHCRQQADERIVFAQRTRRSESPLFQVLYRLYQILHWMLTGVRVRVGNFSAVPVTRLPALVTMPSLWNHYAAAVFQARLPLDLIPASRGVRYVGSSKMNFVSLVMHGLQAISVFSDVVAIRVLMGICIAAGGCGALLVATLFTQWYGGVGVPVWAPYVVGGLSILALSLALGFLSLTLVLLAQRNSLDFIPIRDYRFFVDSLEPLVSVDE